MDRMNIRRLLILALVVPQLASCVKDDLYNTPHPDKGAVRVTTDWSGASSDAVLPQGYIRRIGTEEQAASGTCNAFNTVFEPGRKELLVYNQAEVITVTGTAAPITIQTVTTDDFSGNTEYGEAVVLPKQTINANTAFIQVKLSNNDVFTYKIPTGETLTLESGKKYTYKITVNQTGLSVTSTIEGWGSGVDKEGNATMAHSDNKRKK